MNPTKMNVPAPAATGNEDNEQIPNTTPVTLYLSRWGSNSRDHFGTWSGARLPQAHYAPVLIPVTAVQAMSGGGSQLVVLNLEDVKARNRMVLAAAKLARDAEERDRAFRLKSERDFANRSAEADIFFAIELQDAMGTAEWTPQLEKDAAEFLEEILDRDVEQVTAELLEESRHVRRAKRDVRLAELEQEARR